MRYCEHHIWNQENREPCWRCEELKYADRLKKITNMVKETCVMCGVETKYDINDNVEFRHGYVEGLGQTCPKCSNVHNINEVIIEIPGEMIRNTPNNYDLGEKVRRLLD